MLKPYTRLGSILDCLAHHSGVNPREAARRAFGYQISLCSELARFLRGTPVAAESRDLQFDLAGGTLKPAVGPARRDGAVSLYKKQLPHTSKGSWCGAPGDRRELKEGASLRMAPGGDRSLFSPWMKLVLALAVLVGAGLAACGGGGGSSNSPASSSTSQTVAPSSTIPGGGVTNPGGILLAAPTPVQVAANQSTVSVDIQVPAVASTINAISLAVTAVNAGSAYVSDSGVSARQGNQYWLWIVGTGITPSLTVAFSGPGDIATSGAPLALQNSAGTIYPITVPANAALGARTIILTDSNSNVTTLAGGLEVCSATAPSC